MRTDHIPLVISACCVLHNLSEIHGESFNNRWIEDNEYQQPTQQLYLHHPVILPKIYEIHLFNIFIHNNNEHFNYVNKRYCNNMNNDNNRLNDNNINDNTW